MSRDENGHHVTATVSAEPDWQVSARIARREAWYLRERLRVLGERETEARVLLERVMDGRVGDDWCRRAKEWLRLT